MTSRYAIASDALAWLDGHADDNGIARDDAHEALFISVVQSLIEARGAPMVRDLLQVELDTVGNGGVHEIARGGGHS